MGIFQPQVLIKIVLIIKTVYVETSRFFIGRPPITDFFQFVGVNLLGGAARHIVHPSFRSESIDIFLSDAKI